MNSKQRFELAIEGYKDVSEQLQRWQEIQVENGVSMADIRRAVGEYLGPLDLFGFHRAYFDLEKGVPDAQSIFESDLDRFETAISALKDVLAKAGVPIRPL